MCEACGAESTERCRPWCIGQAAFEEEPCEDCNGLDKHLNGCVYLHEGCRIDPDNGDCIDAKCWS